MQFAHTKKKGFIEFGKDFVDNLRTQAYNTDKIEISHENVLKTVNMFWSVMVFANWLGDSDVLGKFGTNCGFVPTKSETCEVWKIDPGFFGRNFNYPVIKAFHYGPTFDCMILFNKLHVVHKLAVISVVSRICHFSDSDIHDMVKWATESPQSAPEIVKKCMGELYVLVVENLLKRRDEFAKVYHEELTLTTNTTSTATTTTTTTSTTTTTTTTNNHDDRSTPSMRTHMNANG